LSIPNYDDFDIKDKSREDLNPLEYFIYWHQPPGPEAERQFRSDLQLAVNFLSDPDSIKEYKDGQ